MVVSNYFNDDEMKDPKPKLGQAGLKACMVYWHEKEKKNILERCYASDEKDKLVWAGLGLDAKGAINYGYSLANM